MDPITARKMHRTLEPYHGMVYFAPEAAQAYAELGTSNDRTGYFASRAAAMGAVSTEVVVATFFNFDPGLVRSAMQGAWDVADPSAWTDARLRAVDATLRRLLPADVEGDDMARAADLARVAAEACWSVGRPMAAGLLDQPWPESAHLALWHAISIQREFRGDGHIAVLVESELCGCEALVLHGGSGEVPSGILQLTRAWSDPAWADAVDTLRDRGLVDGAGALTEAGRAFREDIEARTDSLALRPWEALGEESCDELRALVRPWSRSLVESGVFGF